MRKQLFSGRSICIVVVLAVCTLASVGTARASSHEEGGAAAEIKALIKAGNDFSRENLRDLEGGISADGSLQFWSSGGLMNWVAPDSPPSEYEHFSATAKHIKVIELPGGEAAVAMYYSEGSFQVKGSEPIDHYMTRVLQVYVKENGEWVVRAAHWSPVAAGSGTTQTTVD
jgi:hypothetical protein